MIYYIYTIKNRKGDKMFLINNKNNLYKFFISISILLVALFIIMLFSKDIKKEEKPNVTTYTISSTSENYTINVDYPRFSNSKITKIITNYIYDYIKDFKKFDQIQKVLDITYDLHYFDNYLNIVFNIENSLTNIKNHNILINLENNKVDYISNIYDKEYLTEEINSLAYHKYSSQIYEQIKNSNINNHTYIISDKKIEIYFNDIKFDNINYIPNIVLNLSSETVVYDETTYDETTKFISFTFDDGPSEYTKDILTTLELNNASATFFVLGNKMDKYENLIKNISNSNSEIGSHSYSHKYLTKISEEELLNEINSVQIKYNTLTGKDIKYLRPPYGNYNNKLQQIVPYPLILWNIDPKDWLNRNSTTISNHILSNASDGSIVLLHDVYPETLEAVKIVLPKLKEMGYEIVNISKLAQIKNYTMENGEIIRNIKQKEVIE